MNIDNFTQQMLNTYNKQPNTRVINECHDLLEELEALAPQKFTKIKLGDVLKDYKAIISKGDHFPESLLYLLYFRHYIEWLLGRDDTYGKNPYPQFHTDEDKKYLKRKASTKDDTARER